MFHKPHLYAFADEASSQIDGQITAMLRNKLEGLEIRNVDGQNISDISLEKAKEVKKKLDDNGLICWSIGSPIGKIGIDDHFEQHLDVLRHTLDVAELLGSSHIRMFSFYIPEGKPYELYRNKVLDRLSKMAETAAGRATLCHENEKGIYGDEPHRCLEILTAVPEMVGVFDPANYVQCGYHPEEAYPLLESRTKYLHIKDAFFSDHSVVPAGHGDGHVAEIVRAFVEREEPCMTIEPHLMTFAGLAALEHDGQKTLMGKYVYKDNDASFDAACDALKAILDSAMKES